MEEDNIIIELREELKKTLRKFEEYDLKLKSKEDLISNFTTSLELKEDQIKTMIDSMNLKEQHNDTLNTSLQIKNEKIKDLEKNVRTLNEKMNLLNSSTVNKDLIAEKETEVEECQNKLVILKRELEKLDEDLELLEAENDKLRNDLASSSDPQIVDWTYVEIPKESILKKIREILSKAVHNVTIAVPDIKDLQDLHLYEVRSHVNMKIMCYIDPSLEDDEQLLMEFESLDNITIRMYEDKDRFLIDRDGEELLFAIIGEGENTNLIIHTRDVKHQRLLRSLVMEGWLRARKLD
ncbi:MAG: coiled-coil domain-containing protein [Promethearchaeota archaeon]